MSSNMFGGEKVRLLTQRTPCPLLSTVVVVLCFSICFAANGTGSLQRVNGTMKKDDQILQDNLKSSARRLGLWHSWVFQQDNNPKRTSKVVIEWLNQARIKVSEWPSQRPDLNPIENTWTMLKKQVHVRKPTNLTNPNPNLTELHQFCQP